MHTHTFYLIEYSKMWVGMVDAGRGGDQMTSGAWIDSVFGFYLAL